MISIILPTYNEADNIKLIVPQISKLFTDKDIKGEIIVVDDNSPDGTADLARALSQKYPVRVYVRKNERGLATAVMKGFELARGEICLIMDADLSHPVDKIPEMINPIVQGNCDATVGSRYIAGGGCKNWSFIRRIVSKGSGILALGLTNLSDPTSGFMAIKKSLLEGIKLDPIGWKIVLEVIVKTNSRFKEIPIVFGDRQFGKSKLDLRVQKEYLGHLWKLYLYKYPTIKAFLILLITTAVFRLLYIRWVELAPDEAYYYTWSRNLQWGYYDHPPMVGFLIRVFTTIGGQGEFGVRWGWVIMGALLTILLYRLGTKMFSSERAGFYAALLMNISLLGSTGAVIVTPDGPQGLFWVLAISSVYKAFRGESDLWWYFTGIWFGLGLLSKYTMILLAPCLFLFLLSSPEGRKWLNRKEPYLAFFLGLLIFSPVIFWNAQNEWISFRMQISHGLEVKNAARLKYFWEYWGGQAAVVTPLLFLALIWAMVKSAVAGFRRQKYNLLLLFWTSTPILLFFAGTSFRTKVEANWPALAYFPALVAMAGIAGEEWAGWKKGRKGFSWAVALSVLLITLVAHLQPIYPLVPIPPKRDPTSRLYGWRILGERIKEVARSMEPGKEIFLLSPRYHMVGEGMFYTQAKFPVYQWDAPQRINNLSWVNAPPVGSQAIFFTEDGNELPHGLAPLFDSCEKLEPLVIRRNSSPVRTHPIWKCSGFKGLK
ncbi:MAG: glycosyltransferase family 39 protein [Deltaproteobacteria bacterium]|nr:glycosyltransferase family 39 protein [Deltaproteobacteria bacterium]